MLAARPAVTEDVLVRAARFFQGIRQNWHVAEVAGVVHPLGHRHEQTAVPGQPGGVEGNRAEGVAEEVADQGGLLLPRGGIQLVPSRVPVRSGEAADGEEGNDPGQVDQAAGGGVRAGRGGTLG
jgi:hypothetical protein